MKGLLVAVLVLLAGCATSKSVCTASAEEAKRLRISCGGDEVSVVTTPVIIKGR